jgi:hypothetical protein
VQEGECGKNIMCLCMKMEKWDLLKLFQEWGRGIKESDGGVNSSIKSDKNFGRCHNVPPVNNNKK